MATKQPSISGISSRRSACDKCRLSKARCLRQHPDQAQCDRCSRTESECVTSPIFRMRSWQPPDASENDIDLLNSSNESNKRQRRSSQQQHHPTPSESSVSLDLHLLGAGGGHSPANGVALYQSLDYHSQSSVPNLSDTEYGEGLRWRMDAAFGHVEGDHGMNLSENLFVMTPPVTSGTDTTASLPSLSSPSTGLSCGFAAEFNQNFLPQNPDENSLTSRDLAPVYTHTEQTPLQRLAKLEYELVTFLVQFDKGQPKTVLKTLFGGQGNLLSPPAVDDILNRTTEFRDVLKLMAVSYLPPSGSSSEATGDDSIFDSEDTRRNSYSSIDSDYDSSSDSSNQLESSAPTPPPRHKLDTTSLLLVLSVYVHLLQLQLLVFTHLYGYLKELSESENPHLQPVLYLRISRVPIGKLAIP